jgi:predicted nuclease with TOPRIM domain
MSDPADQAKAFVDRLAAERDTARHQQQQTDTENHRLRRRLERAQEQYQALDARYAELEQRLHDAEQETSRSRRAMLDHAART